MFSIIYLISFSLHTAHKKAIVAVYIVYAPSGKTVLSDLKYKFVVLFPSLEKTFLLVIITRDTHEVIQD